MIRRGSNSSGTAVQTLELQKKNRHGLRERRECRAGNSNDDAGTAQGPTRCVGYSVSNERWEAWSKRQFDKRVVPMFSNTHWEQNGGQRPTLRVIGKAIRVIRDKPFLHQRFSRSLNYSDRKTEVEYFLRLQ